MDIQVPQILFQIINFSVVVGALTYLLYKPVQKIFEERSQRIAEAQKAADETISERAKLNELKQLAQDQAQQDAQKILDEAKKKARNVEKELIGQAQDKAIKEVEKLHQQWEKERELLATEMRKQFSDSVLVVVERVLDKAFDKKSHTALIDAEVKSILKQM